MNNSVNIAKLYVTKAKLKSNQRKIRIVYYVLMARVICNGPIP